ncbi:putative reverse transcriptase domain-containing protein [Tanacetum coccineum]
MPVEMGTYDVIIGMDWLTKYQAIIDCAKKIVRIPFGSEILIFHGDGSRNERGTQLNIISCTKTQKYLLKGCHVFLAHVTIKETRDKSKKMYRSSKTFPNTGTLSIGPIRNERIGGDQLQEFPTSVIRPSSLHGELQFYSQEEKRNGSVADAHRFIGSSVYSMSDLEGSYHQLRVRERKVDISRMPSELIWTL